MMKKIPNAGSQILKKLRKEAPIEWKKKYGDDLLYLITFVAGGNNGAVYLADNWEAIGYTAGLPNHKSVSMKWDDNENIKQKFVKPTGENKKIILNTLKINISMCLIGVIMGEFLTSKAGIGYLILYGSQIFNLNLVMTGIFLLIIISIVMYELIIFITKE